MLKNIVSTLSWDFQQLNLCLPPRRVVLISNNPGWLYYVAMCSYVAHYAAKASLEWSSFLPPPPMFWKCPVSLSPASFYLTWSWQGVVIQLQLSAIEFQILPPNPRFLGFQGGLSYLGPRAATFQQKASKSSKFSFLLASVYGVPVLPLQDCL